MNEDCNHKRTNKHGHAPCYGQLSQALRNLIRHCVDGAMVSAAAAGTGGPRAAAAPLHSVIAGVASLLGARYQEAWGLALPGEG